MRWIARWRNLLEFGVWLAVVPEIHALDRRPNRSLTIPLNPPVFGYTTEPAFGSLRFTDPLAIVSPSGETNRLFVVEQNGVIAVIPDLTAPARSVFLDIASRVTGGQPTDERGLLGLAFHPGYATNRQFYVFYSAGTNGGMHQRVSRFLADPANPNRALATSEALLISQPDEAGNHNGGDLQFGPDGYLYVSLGDEGNQNDSFNNSQRINKDFFSGILRIDVDRRPGSLAPNAHPSVFPGAYAIPPDNPWVGATTFNGAAVNPATVRTEFWAVGLRNPWRISFDPATGRLWVGDVGGGSREEIDIVERGGNYGWAYREGTLNGPKSGQAPAGFSSLPPVAEYSHGNGPLQGSSVTGGVVYRGDRLSQLWGAYVFADYVSGNVWTVREEGNQATPMVRLFSKAGIAGFGRDPRNGDVLLADQSADTLQRLIYTTNATGAPLPPTLADTGAFDDLLTLRPAEGVVAYDLNVPFWSDGAAKQRWFSLPDTNTFITYQRDANWSFPTGAVWVKHFELEQVRGDPASRRRLETRFIVRNAGGVHGLTYRWTDPPTNALLVAENGLDEAIAIRDGGVVRTQVWHYPSRAECLQCHTPAAGWALGFQTRQLNRDVEHEGGPANQVALLAGAGYFENPPGERYTLPSLAHATNELAGVEWRVRSWLDVNCSPCHQPGGTALGAWDARARTPLSLTGLVRGALDDDRGDAQNRLVVPGSVEHSMLHTRLTIVGEGRMPPLATRLIDDASAALLRRWITNDLPRMPGYAEWQVASFGSTNTPNGVPEADPDGDGASNRLEYLTGTDPLTPGDAWGLQLAREADQVRLRYSGAAGRGFLIEWTPDLRDPASWRALDVSANRYWIGAEPAARTVDDLLTGTSRFYRVRVFEP